MLGEAARKLVDEMTETYVFLRADGRMVSGQVGNKYCTYMDSSLAYDAGMPERSMTVSIYDSPEERAADLNDRGAASVIFSRGWAIRPVFESTKSGEAESMGGHLLAASGSWLRSMGEEGTDLASLREGDFEHGLRDALAELRDTARQVRLKGSETREPVLKGWPGVGDLDIQIASDDGPVWAELKWAKSAGTLSNCLWDAAKLACAVRDGAAVAGYLVAGAPVSEWEKEVDYASLFNFSGFSGDSIFTFNSGFAKCWRDWCEENKNTYPVNIATPICTWPEGQVVARNSTGEPWAIRVARVTAPGDSTTKAVSCDNDLWNAAIG